MLKHREAVSKRQLSTMYAAAGKIEPRLPGLMSGTPGDLMEDAGTVKSKLDEAVQKHKDYASALGELANTHREVLLKTTPILFDPLASPEADEAALEGLRLPFPVVTCDFMSQSGMSLPVYATDDKTWVGLICATLIEQAEGIIDVWPVVSTLYANEADEAPSEHKGLIFGCVRFGGEVMPPTNPAFSQVDFDGGSAMIISEGVVGDLELWAGLWVIKPALAALSALRLLDAVNVSLEPATLSRPERRRAERAGAEPALEVIIRRSKITESKAVSPSSIDWQHRWTVRGHWMHFHRGPIFDANPRKRVPDDEGVPCVKVWCPPFVKGPEDKPLVLKSRRLT